MHGARIRTWYQVNPLSAIGPVAYGLIIALKSVESVSVRLHRAKAGGSAQCSTGVPPQLFEIKPIGTVPPRPSKTSRPKIQQTAEKCPKEPPPLMDTLFETAHGCETVCRFVSGVLDDVP